MNLKKTAIIATVSVVLFTASPLLAHAPAEYWSGTGIISFQAFADLGFIPFEEWGLHILTDGPFPGSICHGEWQDNDGHTGTITGYVDLNTGYGYGSWTCDQHSDNDSC